MMMRSNTRDGEEDIKYELLDLHDKQDRKQFLMKNYLGQYNVPCYRRWYQASAWSNTALRQGNMVFGFFLDGQDQQVPVIMGILGNNAQTSQDTN